jgi:hypothetical protein
LGTKRIPYAHPVLDSSKYFKDDPVRMRRCGLLTNRKTNWVLVTFLEVINPTAGAFLGATIRM